MATWGQMQDGTTWRARNIFVKGNTISIEWDCDVKLKDGRSVSFKEVAIHEVKGGKIVAERYYYDPGQLAPPAMSRMRLFSRALRFCQATPPSLSRSASEPSEP